MSSARPCVLFFNINGSGLGHMSTCLAYAHRMREHVRPVFFSLASAIEMIHDMGFEADYFVSPFWSRASSRMWNQQLAIRLGMLFERVRPEVVVFDGTWPFQGLLDAAAAYKVPRMVWSNLVLYKEGAPVVPVSESLFDLVIRLGELGTRYTVEEETMPGRRVRVPPATLLRDEELLERNEARDALGLRRDGRYALFSLGPGNLKDVSGIGRGLIDEMKARGFVVVWARAPISVKDVPLPEDVVPVSIYPLARYMRAFDVLAGAAGYNTCCEVVQSRIPTLFVPNTKVIDDQTRRAKMVAQAVPAVVSPCETAAQRTSAVARLMAQLGRERAQAPCFELSGAERAADEILRLMSSASLKKQGREKSAGTRVYDSHAQSNTDIEDHMSLQAELEALRRLLDELAEVSDDDLMKRYELRRASPPHGVYWRLRRLAAQLLRGLQAIPIKRRQPWPPGLKHFPDGARAQPLLIWAVGVDRRMLREACRKFAESRRVLSGFAPVLVTDVADFAFFSRLGWLIEYLPPLEGDGEPYEPRKARFLARLYRNAPALPLSANLALDTNAEEIRRWIQR